MRKIRQAPKDFHKATDKRKLEGLASMDPIVSVLRDKHSHYSQDE